MNTEEKLQAVVSQAETDGQKWHTIIHGNNETTVPTENGDVPTVAKQLKDVYNAITGGVSDVVSEAEAARDIAVAAKNETVGFRDTTAQIKTETQTIKEDTQEIKDAATAVFNNISVAIQSGVNTIQTESTTQQSIIQSTALDQIALATEQADRAEQYAIQAGVPVGIILSFMGNVVPTGFLLCDGAAVSREQYAQLFACIGTTYGVGDSQTTFNLPNLTGRFLQGAETAGIVKEAGLPDHAHTFTAARNGVMYSDLDDGKGQSVGDKAGNLTELASANNPIYGASDTVQPPAITAKMIIKY